MGIFSEAPKSFLVAWPSRLASKLKSIISDRLHTIISDLSDDDVLAEYITVLLCNGKTQYEARDNLDAFLGRRTEDFVSWLWDLLLEYEHKRLVDSTGTSMSSRGSYSEKDGCTERAKEYTNQSTGNGNAAMKSRASDSRPSKCNTSAKDERYFRSPSTDMKKKAFSTYSRNKVPSLKPSRSLPSSFTDKFQFLEDGANFSQGGSSANILEDHTNVAQGSSSAKIGSLYSDKTRGSVWDRLGKPHVDLSVDGTATGALSNVSQHMEHSWLPEHTGSQLITKKTREALKVMRNCAYNLWPLQNVAAATTTGVTSPSGVNFGRKRNFVQINKGHYADLMRSRSVGNTFGKPTEVHNGKGKETEIVPKVNQHLHQIGNKMFRLKIKSLDTVNDDHKTPFEAGDLYTHTLADILKITPVETKSRTVYVTNVPFLATKESLLLHFSHCGAAAVNVFFLPDRGSISESATKAAFVTFATKESADKALELNPNSS